MNTMSTGEAKGSGMSRRKAFEELLIPHMDALYRRAFYFMGNEADASDLVQETFLRAYRKFDTFKQGSNEKAWIFTILQNLFRNEYRNRLKQPVVGSLDDPDENRAIEPVDWQPVRDFFSRLDRPWEEPELKNALGELPDSFRDPIMLIDVEGLSYEEASGMLELPLGTLRSRLHRARKILAEKLYRYAITHGYVRPIEAS